MKLFNLFDKEHIATAEERRTLSYYCLSVGLVVIIGDLLFHDLALMTPTEITNLKFLVVGVSLILGALYIKRLPVAYAEALLLALVVGALDRSVLIHISYLEGAESVPKILTYSFWSAHIYIALFFVFPPRHAQFLAWIHVTVMTLSGLVITAIYQQGSDMWSIAIHLLQSSAGQSMFIATLAVYTRMLAKRQAAVQQLRYRVYTDELTTLTSRHYLNIALIDQFAQAQQERSTFAVVLIDIDHFKRINDTHGHVAGDAVLQEFAQRMQRQVDDTHTLGRWGGEEFMLLLPGHSLRAAEVVAQQLQQALNATEFSLVKRLTASFGVAEYRTNDTTVSLIERADRALYQAKIAGRNQVCSYGFPDMVTISAAVA